MSSNPNVYTTSTNQGASYKPPYSPRANETRREKKRREWFENKISQSCEMKAMHRLTPSPNTTTPDISISGVEVQTPTTLRGGKTDKADGVTLTCADNDAGETCEDWEFGEGDVEMMMDAWEKEAAFPCPPGKAADHAGSYFMGIGEGEKWGQSGGEGWK
jgi:hypothetical protein